tara:strand:- start:365 stop:640 length:276 start_codon:yes stop_codon:yes gene_type:complete
MIPNFKVGDLVQYDLSLELEGDALPPNAPEEQYMRHGIITGFVDVETGQRLSGDFTTHDKVIAASILGPKGSDVILMTNLTIISKASKGSE